MRINIFSEVKPESYVGDISITITRKESEKGIDWEISEALSEFCKKNNIVLRDYT